MIKSKILSKAVSLSGTALIQFCGIIESALQLFLPEKFQLFHINKMTGMSYAYFINRIKLELEMQQQRNKKAKSNNNINNNKCQTKARSNHLPTKSFRSLFSVHFQ